MADVVTDYATGKFGKDLLAVIRDRCRPTTVAGNIDDASMKSLLIKLYSVNSVNDLPDFLADNAVVGNAVFRTDNHILSSWFNQNNPDRNLAAADLYNIFPTTFDHRNQRQEMPLFDNSDHRFGPGATPDGMYHVYQPGQQWKGAIARMALYVAAIYGTPSAWPGNGAIIFNDFEEYPLLSDRAITQYLKWHEAYPPDADEKERAQLIATLQGNINPFIVHPNLA
ncbi:MAG: endonuclease, partial [Muribaculum sp.]|nr:endonuclease [Muribaculum sp.]